MIQSFDGAYVGPIQLLTKFAVPQTFCDDVLSAFVWSTVPKINGNSTKCERERELQKNNVPSTFHIPDHWRLGLGLRPGVIYSVTLGDPIRAMWQDAGDTVSQSLTRVS